MGKRTVSKTVDRQYQDLLIDILDNGNLKETRAGSALSVFGTHMTIDMRDSFPLLTVKKMFTKGIFGELLWFLSGSTNIKFLVENGIHVWDDDAYRYYLELLKNNILSLSYNPLDKDAFLERVKKGETIYNICRKGDNARIDYIYGDLGDVYGKQWRSFGYRAVDQIGQIIKTLKWNPDDRRMLCVAYNPDVEDTVALPPCHVLFQFYTRKLNVVERFRLLKNRKGYDIKLKDYVLGANSKDGLKAAEAECDKAGIPVRELSLSWYQRSVDTFLGLPFNIASYAFLTHMVAQVVGMSVGDLVFFGGDTHLYTNHISQAEEIISRPCHDSPKLWLNPSVKDIDDFGFDDMKIIGYESEEAIKAPLNVGL